MLSVAIATNWLAVYQQRTTVAVAASAPAPTAAPAPPVPAPPGCATRASRPAGRDGAVSTARPGFMSALPRIPGTTSTVASADHRSTFESVQRFHVYSVLLESDAALRHTVPGRALEPFGRAPRLRLRSRRQLAVAVLHLNSSHESVEMSPTPGLRGNGPGLGRAAPLRRAYA